MGRIRVGDARVVAAIGAQERAVFALPWSAADATQYRTYHPPPRYAWIKKNVLRCSASSRAALQCEAAEPCGCQRAKKSASSAMSPTMRSKGVLCNEDCVNVLMKVECTEASCEFARLGTCMNTAFQRTTRADIEALVRVAVTPGRGHGVFLKQGVGLIKAGTFLMEFTGEVIDAAEFTHRSEQRSGVVVSTGGFSKGAAAAAEEEAARSPAASAAAAAASASAAAAAAGEGTGHQYVMDLGGGLMVDATHKGNVSRLINHSCAPNCAVEKWAVGGVARLGIFARETLREGVELSFDYQFASNLSVPTKCLCGAKTCRGFLGTSRVSEKDKAAQLKKNVPLAEANRRFRAAQLAKLRQLDAKVRARDSAAAPSPRRSQCRERYRTSSLRLSSSSSRPPSRYLSYTLVASSPRPLVLLGPQRTRAAREGSETRGAPARARATNARALVPQAVELVRAKRRGSACCARIRRRAHAESVGGGARGAAQRGGARAVFDGRGVPRAPPHPPRSPGGAAQTPPRRVVVVRHGGAPPPGRGRAQSAVAARPTLPAQRLVDMPFAPRPGGLCPWR
jgi:hypothetical protein